MHPGAVSAPHSRENAAAGGWVGAAFSLRGQLPTISKAPQYLALCTGPNTASEVSSPMEEAAGLPRGALPYAAGVAPPRATRPSPRARPD
jgi:hypothetical protein